ncbi:MAG: DUF2851 family protein [Salibacteraceae bacterium]
MNEEFLQFVWGQGLFEKTNLATTNGLEVIIQNSGVINAGGGPDFRESRIKIGKHLWVGDVEIHFRSSQWYEHGHHTDAYYNGVILHVVYEADRTIYNERGDELPQVELKGRIPKSMIDRFEYLMSGRKKIHCSASLGEVPTITVRAWLDRLTAERLERKTSEVEFIFKNCNRDWRQTFFVLLAGYFGQNTNKLAFQSIAMRCPVTIIDKNRNRPELVEAMLFGVAGLLKGDPVDDYHRELTTHYAFLKSKYNLEEIPFKLMFGGVRPEAFPTRRLGVLAALMQRFDDWFTALVRKQSGSLTLPDIAPNPYWINHYRFGKASRISRRSAISDSLKNLLLINAVCPFLYHYARSHGNHDLQEWCMERLCEIPPERNVHTRLWEQHGVKAESAAESQALIELSTQYCKPKKCVLCNIGRSIILKQ